MPGILTHSITHFNFLPSESLQSSAHFLLRDHEDQPQHTFHPCFPAITRSANPLGHPSSPGLSLLYCSMHPLIWSIYHPSQPSQTLYHSTIYFLIILHLSWSPFKQRFLFFHTPYVYKTRDDANSSLLFLTLSVTFDPPKSQVHWGSCHQTIPLTIYTHALSCLYLTICFSPWLTAFIFTPFQQSISMTSILCWIAE